MLSLPFRAFVFKGFISKVTVLLLAGAFICMPNNISGAEEPSVSSPATESSALSDTTMGTEPSEPTKVHKLEPYKFPFEEEKTDIEAEDHFFGQFMKMLGTLGLLIAIMFAASWSLKRILNTRVQQLNESSFIKVVEKRALSNKSFLYLVDVQDKTFVIGESMNSITLLATLPKIPEQESTGSDSSQNPM